MEGQETQTQEAQEQVVAQELSLEQFFGEDETPDHLKETSTEETLQEEVVNTSQEEQGQETQKETSTEESQVVEMSDERFNELAEKAEKENLSDEEVAELKAAGHEVGVEDPSVDEILAQMENGQEVDLTDFSEETINALKERGVEIEEVDDSPIEWTAPEVANELQQIYGDQFDVNTPEGFNEAAKDIVNKYNTITNNLNGVLENSPELQKIMDAMMKGSDFMSAASLELGIEDLNPSPGDDGYEAWVEAKAQKKIQQEAEKKRQDSIKNNWKSSQENVVKYFKDNQVSRDRQDKIVSTLDQLVADYAEGKVDGYIDLIAKGLFADVDAKRQAQQAVAQELNKRHVIKRKNVGGKPSVRSASVDTQPGTHSLEGVKKLFGEA